MKLLIVIDYQNDFVDGSLGFEEAKCLENNLIKKIKEYQNDEIIYTLDTHDENYFETKEGKNLPVKHCIKGTLGHELYGEIKKLKRDRDLVFLKNTFPSLDLANYLKDKEYEKIELVGVVSNICVISNAIMVASALPNTKIIVNKNLIASNNKELEEKAIDIMKNLFIEVIDD